GLLHARHRGRRRLRADRDGVAVRAGPGLRRRGHPVVAAHHRSRRHRSLGRNAHGRAVRPPGLAALPRLRSAVVQGRVPPAAGLAGGRRRSRRGDAEAPADLSPAGIIGRMPKSKSKRSRYQPPPKRKPKPSPRWYGPTILGFMFAGVVVIVLNYLGLM